MSADSGLWAVMVRSDAGERFGRLRLSRDGTVSIAGRKIHATAFKDRGRAEECAQAVRDEIGWEARVARF